MFKENGEFPRLRRYRTSGVPRMVDSDVGEHSKNV